MAEANSLLTRFKLDKLLNTDTGGRRIVLHGTIDDKPALLLAERGAFSTDPQYLASFAQLLTRIQNLGDNDIYRWYLANSKIPSSEGQDEEEERKGSQTSGAAPPPDLKINLIYPCTDKHIRKYSFQQSRVVRETPQIYSRYVRPYMQLCREEGRLNWIFNILDGRTEQENVLFRSAESDPNNDYLLLPDLNWDRSTLSSLHLLALVQRRDIWSVRDLKKSLAPWLRRLHSTLTNKVTELYPGVEGDMLKFYIHYQPTYYHFHIHIVHVNLDAGATQATGKALGLENVISQLENLQGGEDAGMHLLELTYTVGEASELWTQIYLPLKQGKTPTVGSG
jgi:m7GpppX diphosphatase